MKVLFAIKKFDDASGGAERVFATVASGLAARGHDISILSFDETGGNGFYPLSPLVRRLPLGDGNADRPTTLIDAVHRVSAVRRVVRDDKPDVVVAFMHSMYVPAVIAITALGIPVIASEHTVVEYYESRPIEYMLAVVAMRLARHTTVLSRSVKGSFPRFVRARLVVMPNPVERSSSGEPAGSAVRENIILSVGRLVPLKDHATLIDAFTLLANRYPDWVLRIVGEGPLRNELNDRVRRAGLDDRVQFAGVTRDIGREYAGARVFAMSSRYESFGLVTAEAMVHGLPVVGFADCPGTNELIVDGKNGILVRNRSSVDFAHAIETLIINAPRRERLAHAAQESCREFAPERIIGMWEQLIRSACEAS